MLTLKTLRGYVFRLKKYQEPVEKWVLPIILLLYPFIGVNQGVDITDTTYSLGNYEYMSLVDPMWMIATFIPNLVGRALSFLPMGNTMLGMNIYCTFFISLTALIAYYMLQRWIPGWMVFLGEMIAESLCWCPRVILYNYLTYLFFTLGVLLLLHAMTDYEKKGYRFLLAGVCFGINVMVRFPNIVEVVLILALWYYEGIHKHSMEEIRKKTGLCVLGFFIGFFIPLLVVILMYGIGAYPEMISSLFSMTKGAEDYSGAGMTTAILATWFNSIRHMIIVIPFMMAAAIMLMLRPGKFYWVKRLLYVIGLLIMVRYFFAVRIVTRSYYYYDSMFEAAMMFLIAGVIILLFGITPLLHGQGSERSFCLAALLIILITPIGSNNYTYPLINNMFIVAPVILWMFRRIRQVAGNREIHFTWKAMFMAILILLCVQGGLFHCFYSFVDGTDGTPRDALIGTSDLPRARGMYTNVENAILLSELYDELQDMKLTDNKLLQFGNAPGLSYLMEMEPAIFSTWPNLDSNTTEKFDASLSELQNASKEDLPVVIIAPDFGGAVNAQTKYEHLLDFMEQQKYNKVFENKKYEIYSVEQ